jgi:hypothetical protein
VTRDRPARDEDDGAGEEPEELSAQELAIVSNGTAKS